MNITHIAITEEGTLVKTESEEILILTAEYNGSAIHSVVEQFAFAAKLAAARNITYQLWQTHVPSQYDAPIVWILLDII